MCSVCSQCTWASWTTASRGAGWARAARGCLTTCISIGARPTRWALSTRSTASSTRSKYYCAWDQYLLDIGVYCTNNLQVQHLRPHADTVRYRWYAGSYFIRTLKRAQMSKCLPILWVMRGHGHLMMEFLYRGRGYLVTNKCFAFELSRPEDMKIESKYFK